MILIFVRSDYWLYNLVTPLWKKNRVSCFDVLYAIYTAIIRHLHGILVKFAPTDLSYVNAF